jgi:PASTA domain
VSDREPAGGGQRPSDDEMTGHDADEPTMDEVERGRDALRELGSEPLPADALARLDGRLEGELGRPAPVRRGRRLPRLAFAIPAAGVALAAVVIVAVLATNGGSSKPQQELAASSMRAKSAAPVVPKASAGGAAGDSSAAPSVSGAPVEVPDLVGHGLGYVRTATRANGLKWDTFVGTRCAPAPGARVGRQLPAAGTTVAAGTTIRVSIGKCRQAEGSGS